MISSNTPMNNSSELRASKPMKSRRPMTTWLKRIVMMRADQRSSFGLPRFRPAFLNRHGHLIDHFLQYLVQRFAAQARLAGQDQAMRQSRCDEQLYIVR